MELYKVVIIGSGPAGWTAALYSARANLKPFVFEGFQSGGIPGGQLMTTTEIENYPGFPEGVTGPELMEKFKKQAIRFGTKSVMEDVSEVKFSQRPFTVKGTGITVQAQTVIMATGARAKYLGLSSEEKLMNKGVSACAVCDGALPIFRDKDLIVVGGGDSAMEEALYLTKYGKKVTIVHRRDAFRASQIMQDRAKKNPKIEFVLNSTVTEVLGKEYVEGAKLKDVKNGEERILNCEGFFLGIGHEPNTKFLRGHLALEETGYVKVDSRLHTSVPGVFACGDCQDHIYRQAVTAAGTGCMAALEAEWFLQKEEAG